jgi:hypothetical protein
LKPIPLDFLGHFLSCDDIESVTDIPKKVIEGNKKKGVANENKIFEFP